MTNKYARINGYFKLPDNCDLNELKDYEVLRKIANELKKAKYDGETCKRTTFQKIILWIEIKLLILSDKFAWRRYWNMRSSSEFNHSYFMTIGDNDSDEYRNMEN